MTSYHYEELVQHIIRWPGINQHKTGLLFILPSCDILPSAQDLLLVYFHVRVKSDAHLKC